MDKPMGINLLRHIISYCENQQARASEAYHNSDKKIPNVEGRVRDYYFSRGRLAAYQDIIVLVTNMMDAKYIDEVKELREENERLRLIDKHQCASLSEQKDNLTLLQNRCMGITQGKHCKTCNMLHTCNALIILGKLIEEHGDQAVKTLFNFKEGTDNV